MEDIHVQGSDIIIVAIVVLWVGNLITQKIALLKKYSIPIAVTGGLLCSTIVAIIASVGGPKITFDMAIRDTLLMVFFTTIGISAKFSRRQAGGGAETSLKVGDLEMDLLARQVTRAGKPIDLQPREFKLLEVLMRHEGQVITRTMLLEQVWNYHFDPQTNVIDVHVSRLRQKIDKDFERPLLHTVRGAGYSLRA